MKVCKFGGSSLSDAQEFSRVKDILLSDNDRKVVVVSALGKRNKEDNKITDLLYLTYQHCKYHVDFTPVFNQIRERYLGIEEELNLNAGMKSELDWIEKRLKSDRISEEELVSCGEYLSARLMANYLGWDFLDARDLFFFDYEGKIDEEKTVQAISDAFEEHERAVIPGFYGAYPNGKTCLFSRGGSDVSASFVSKALHASLYENWTDVSGFYMASPAIVENPRRIKEISYVELRELSYMGASVIHEETILPLQDEGIPLAILNTNHPEEGGTWICKDTPDKEHLITGITGKKGFISLTFVKKKASDKLKVILEVLNVFDQYHIPIEHIPTSIDSFSVIIEKSHFEEKLYDVIARLKIIDDIVSISEDDDIALLAVVGRNMVKKTGTSGRILSVFGKEGINIKLIDQGREEINIIIGIANADFEKSIRSLYQAFGHELVK